MLSDISNDILVRFKEKLHILHDDEDMNLKHLLLSSYDNLQEKCGAFPLNLEQGLNLVFERARYDYYGKIEYFDVNFVGEISSLMIRIEKERRLYD